MTNRRSLSTRERLRLFTLHKGICHICGCKIDGVREEWEISHDTPVGLYGADDDENRKPAHKRQCHARRTAERDIPMIAKADRLRAKHIGAKPKRPWSKFRKKMSGEVVLREE